MCIHRFDTRSNVSVQVIFALFRIDPNAKNCTVCQVFLGKEKSTISSIIYAFNSLAVETSRPKATICRYATLCTLFKKRKSRTQLFSRNSLFWLFCCIYSNRSLFYNLPHIQLRMFLQRLLLPSTLLLKIWGWICICEGCFSCSILVVSVTFL